MVAEGTFVQRQVLAATIIEGRVDGRFFERYVDGTEYEIGRVTAYEPPTLVGFSWRAPSWDRPTQVQIRFTPEGSGTRVELEHSGWEQAENIRETRKDYDRGWDLVLGHYATYTTAAA